MSLLKLKTILSGITMLIAAANLSVMAQTSFSHLSTASTTTGAVRTQPLEPGAIKEENKLDAGHSKIDFGTARPKNHATTEASTTVSPEPQTAGPGEWQFQLTPYLWIASISGRAGIGNLVTDTSTGVTSTGVELNFGFMGTLEARRDKLIILTDLQYSDLATEKGNPGPLFSSTRASFKTFVLDPEVGYRVLDNGKGATLDVLGGLRYWHLNADIQFRAGVLPATGGDRSRSWIDAVGGLRGKAALSKKLFVSGKADLGGGGSKFTYQLFGGVGINVNERVALIGGYRDLKVNYDKDNFLFDMSLHGPIMGVGFKF